MSPISFLQQEENREEPNILMDQEIQDPKTRSDIERHS